MQFHGVGPSDAINTDLYPSLLLRETRKLVSKQADQTARLVVRFTPNAFGANDQPTERSALLSSSGSRQEGPRTLDASKVSLETENPRRGGAEGSEVRNSWELLRRVVSRGVTYRSSGTESQPVRRLLWITGL